MIVGAAHLLDRHHPVRRASADHAAIDSLDDALQRTCGAMKARGRDPREELQPAAPRAAPADHRGRARDGHDGGARGRLAVRAQHDDGGGRPHRRRARDPGGATSTTTSRSCGRRRRWATRRPCIVAYGGLAASTTGTQTTDVWEHPRPAGLRAARACSTRARARREMAPEEEYNSLAVARDGAASCCDAGVRVQLGAHGQREGLGAHWEHVDARPGRHDAAAGAARARRSTARTTWAWTRTSARSKPASWPTWWCIDGDPLDGHPPVPTASSR